MRKIEECTGCGKEKEIYAKKLCRSCYDQQRRHNSKRKFYNKKQEQELLKKSGFKYIPKGIYTSQVFDWLFVKDDELRIDCKNKRQLYSASISIKQMVQKYKLPITVHINGNNLIVRR